MPFGRPWAGADLILEPGVRRWHMPARRRLPRCFDLDVTVRGRGGASRPRTEAVHLPLAVADRGCPKTAEARPALRLVDAPDHALDEPSHLRTLVR